MKLPSIQQICLEAGRAACRFPLVLVCALAGVIAALSIVESEPFPKSSMAFPILLAAALGLPLLIALALFAEKRKWNTGLSVGSQLSATLLLVGYACSLPATLPQEPALHIIRFGLLAAGLVLMAMLLPFLRPGESNGFWHYNKELFYRLFITAVFSAVLFAGLAIALAALDNLFGISVPGKRYAELWALVAGLFSPWFFLPGVPKDLDGLDRIEEYPKGLKVFAQYILQSLVLVYLVILYAYLLKILLQWSWPKGWVSSLILGFSATAMVSLLLMHPIRNQSENAWIRAASKWLYVVLIPLVPILFLAVTERIRDYGITESRYAGIALGFWLSAQVLYFLCSKAKSIKFPVGSLCLLAFLMSFGPWGMLSVSQRSQIRRLQKLLTNNEILIYGRVHGEHGKVSQEDAREIHSIVTYLQQIHGYDSIQPWFTDRLRQDTKTGYSQSLPASDVLGKMGLADFNYAASAAGGFFSLDTRKPANISGYDRLLEFRLQSRGENKIQRFDGDGISYVANDSLDTLTVLIGDTHTGFDTLQLDVGAFADLLMRKYGDAGSRITGNMTPETMALVAEQKGQRVKLLFRQLALGRSKGKRTVLFFSGDISYTVRVKG